jgi:hypothetical protein
MVIKIYGGLMGKSFLDPSVAVITNTAGFSKRFEVLTMVKC